MEEKIPTREELILEIRKKILALHKECYFEGWIADADTIAKIQLAMAKYYEVLEKLTRPTK
jgi:hypothetical protein